MKVVLAGAYGKLGGCILTSLVKAGHEVVAADLMERDIEGLDKSKVTFKKLDVTNKDALKGICDGASAVITTVGLTRKSDKLTNYDIDFQGNLNLLNEAKSAGVKNFVYISVIKADLCKDAPMVHAKYLFEEELKKSGLTYVIHRPTGYMYDIVKVFKPMVEKGEVTLLGKKDYSCNVVDCPDFGDFIVEHMLDNNKTYNVGGKETYTYREIAEMCFKAMGKEAVIKTAPVFLFNVLASLPKNKKNGTAAMIRFSKFTLTHDLIGDTVVGNTSFKEFVNESLGGKNNA